MLALLLLIPSAANDTVAGFKLTPSKPTLGCISGACTPPPRQEDYRVPYEPDPLARTSKDRAFANDGTKCQVVGDKFCTSRGRTIFKTDFDD